MNRVEDSVGRVVHLSSTMAGTISIRQKHIGTLRRPSVAIASFSCGEYTGGALILYELGIIIEMGPGDMIPFPDSLSCIRMNPHKGIASLYLHSYRRMYMIIGTVSTT
jgi:hypothetical protein